MLMINPFVNPYNIYFLLRSLVSDPKRIFRFKPEKIKRYQDKQFRKLVKYAYTVPLYHKKYKEAGIHPRDIKGIGEIKKLPFISKQDIMNGYPDDIIPKKCNKKREYLICTGGTTGKPISLFTDFKLMTRNVSLFLRDLAFHEIDFRHARVSHLGNFSTGRIDLVAEKYYGSYLKKFYQRSFTLNIDVNNPIKEILDKLDRFRPKVIYSYPTIFQHLAYFKRKGYAKNLKPKVLLCSGAMLDDYTRSYVEDAFNCKLLNFYSSVEATGVIAMECKYHNWHIYSDYHYLESINDNNKISPPRNLGHMVLTRLSIGGTPMIRYTGMDDWIKLGSNKKCKCGLNTLVIERLEGRKKANIILPNGKIFPPGAFCFINPVLHKLKTFKVKKYQIIQRKINEIEILLEIDEELKDKEPSFELIAKKIKEIYKAKTGPDVKIIVRKVDKIVNKENKRKPAPIVLSYINHKKALKTL